jgi:hypothetical protein
VLRQRDAKLAEAQQAQADLIKKQRELDDAKREMDLTIQKQVLAAVRIRAKTAENLTDGRRTGGAAVGCGLFDRKFDCLPPTIGL